MRTQRGFTLTELIVVLAIVSLLMSFLLPGLAVARRKSRTAVCVNNLRQVGLAMAHYAAEHDDQIPLELAAGGWAPSPAVEGQGPLAWLVDTAYAGKGKKDKDDEGASPMLTPKEAMSFLRYCGDDRILQCPEQGHGAGVSYGKNGRLAGRFKQVSNPSETPVVFDATKGVSYRYSDMDARHIGFANCLYADSHVDAIEFNPLLAFGAIWLPGGWNAVYLRISGKIWERLDAWVLEDDAVIASTSILREAKGFNMHHGRFPTRWMDPSKHRYQLRVRVETKGGKGSSHIWMKICDGKWTQVAKMLPHDPPTTLDLTTPLMAPM